MTAPKARVRTPVAAALLGLALLTAASGCGNDTGTGAAGDPASHAAPATSPPASASATEPSTGSSTPVRAAALPPFGTGTRPLDGGYGSGNGLGVTGVRTGRQPGFDRIVFDFGGTGTPGWYVRYVAHPRQDGSGDAIPLKGTVYLQVGLRGIGYPEDTGVPAWGDITTRVPGTGTAGVTEVYPGGDFEGDQAAFIGLTGTRRPFRAFTLTNPTRVVVDVRHP